MGARLSGKVTDALARGDDEYCRTAFRLRKLGIAGKTLAFWPCKESKRQISWVDLCGSRVLGFG